MSEYKCQCGHLHTDHPRRELRRGFERKCIKCRCEKYIGSSVNSQAGYTVDSVIEKLREVLREYNAEYCPNCERHLEVSDLETGIVKEEHEHRNIYTHQIVCQNCYTKVLELVVSAFRDVNVDLFLMLLNQHKTFGATINIPNF